MTLSTHPPLRGAVFDACAYVRNGQHHQRRGGGGVLLCIYISKLSRTIATTAVRAFTITGLGLPPRLPPLSKVCGTGDYMAPECTHTSPHISKLSRTIAPTAVRAFTITGLGLPPRLPPLSKVCGTGDYMAPECTHTSPHISKLSRTIATTAVRAFCVMRDCGVLRWGRGTTVYIYLIL